MKYFGRLQKNFCQVLTALDQIDYLEKQSNSQSEHQDIINGTSKH